MTGATFDTVRQATLAVPCPIDLCGAELGEVCVQLATGHPLQALPAHDARIRTARDGPPS